jgi:hypothetical protein
VLKKVCLPDGFKMIKDTFQSYFAIEKITELQTNWVFFIKFIFFISSPHCEPQQNLCFVCGQHFLPRRAADYRLCNIMTWSKQLVGTLKLNCMMGSVHVTCNYLGRFHHKIRFSWSCLLPIITANDVMTVCRRVHWLHLVIFSQGLLRCLNYRRAESW